MVLVAKQRDEQATADAKLFGARLRALRSRAAMTQATLADKLRVDYQAVSRLERGGSVPNWSTVNRIAAAVGATPDDFLSAQEWAAAGLAMEDYITGSDE